MPHTEEDKMISDKEMMDETERPVNVILNAAAETYNYPPYTMQRKLFLSIIRPRFSRIIKEKDLDTDELAKCHSNWWDSNAKWNERYNPHDLTSQKVVIEKTSRLKWFLNGHCQLFSRYYEGNLPFVHEPGFEELIALERVCGCQPGEIVDISLMQVPTLQGLGFLTTDGKLTRKAQKLRCFTVEKERNRKKEQLLRMKRDRAEKAEKECRKRQGKQHENWMNRVKRRVLGRWDSDGLKEVT